MKVEAWFVIQMNTVSGNVGRHVLCASSRSKVYAMFCKMNMSYLTYGSKNSFSRGKGGQPEIWAKTFTLCAGLGRCRRQCDERVC